MVRPGGTDYDPGVNPKVSVGSLTSLAVPQEVAAQARETMRDRFGHDVKAYATRGRAAFAFASRPNPKSSYCSRTSLCRIQPLRGDRADLVHARACEPYASANTFPADFARGGSFCVPTATTDGSLTLPWPRPARRPNKPGRFFAMKRWPKCTFGTSRTPATLSGSCAAPKRRALAQRRTCLPLTRWSLGGRGDESPT